MKIFLYQLKLIMIITRRSTETLMKKSCVNYQGNSFTIGINYNHFNYGSN